MSLTPSDGRLDIVSGSAHGATTGTMSTGTTYSIKAHSKSDGTGDIEFTTTTWAGSGANFASYTGGNTLSSGLILEGQTSTGTTDYILDDYKIFTSDPGSTP
jgi:hypothetical protein